MLTNIARKKADIKVKHGKWVTKPPQYVVLSEDIDREQLYMKKTGVNGKKWQKMAKIRFFCRFLIIFLDKRA